MARSNRSRLLGDDGNLYGWVISWVRVVIATSTVPPTESDKPFRLYERRVFFV